MPRSARTPAERSLHGRIAAYDSWVKTEDRSARTAPAREAFQRRFEDQVDPERKLPEQVRAQMAEAARNAYYARLARQGLEARRAKAARNRNSAPTDRSAVPDPADETCDVERRRA